MNHAEIRFYGILNDFLPSSQRGKSMEFSFLDRSSIKDTIESFGIPHPEIEFLLVNGMPQPFSYTINDQDKISVYPHFFQLEISPEWRVSPPFPQDIRFVLDVHLGKLASYLRMLGMDTLYENNYDDPTLAQISSTEDRILLTRDIGLLKRSQVVYGYFVRATDPLIQIKEVCLRFSFIDKIKPLTRCMECNGILAVVAKEEIWDQIPEKVRQNYTTFYLCSSCKNVYWPGTHCEKMEQVIQEITKTKELF
ncbi:MAG: Mut7-C ubiquitin/RNAse domain-containing protein [Candidatus Brocadiae bacterium]|nr:Mut7-C ubiquitin/RNAse domain-containing protein [Candidatus Brocadiia bacterium]